ncbi:PAS domain-containing protein [Gracilimonas sp.]|uniref:PAS domain-containing protein n=1 Tax=Gracilimonas sp. TaxID=1974203 RepID=UPI002871CE9D|nr:PAS domain-containing protein [Gracilimonas sp.]
MIKSSKDVSFFEVQPMFICEQTSLTIMDINEVTSEVLGYTRDKILNKKIFDLGEKISSKELGLELKNESHLSSDDIWLFKTQADEHLYFQLSGHLINYKGNPAKLIIAHNVTNIVRKGTSKKVLSSQLNLNNFPLAEIEWDPQLNIINWSEKAEELFGYTSDEAIEKDQLLKKFIHKDDLDFVRNKIKEAHKKGEQEVSVINRNITKDGDIIYCEWYNSLLYNAEGEVVSIYSLTHDVTDREKALSDTKRSMMSYQDLFNGIIIEANKGLESTFGYKRSEIIGEHNKILSAPGKYDEERVEEIIQKAKDGEPGKYEGWGKKKNGEVFPTEFLVNTGNYFGEDVLIVIERDITEQKQSEEALKQREGLLSKLFNSSPIGIALLNEHHD